MNLVMALSLGADDFLAKPFDLGVLTAKIEALCGAPTPSAAPWMSSGAGMRFWT